MSLRVANTVVDCADPQRVGEFWSALLARPLGGPDDAGDRWIEVDDDGLEIIFVTVPEGKSGKNRVHIDLRPDDQAAEVERAISLEPATSTSVSRTSPGWSSPIRRGTSSASSARGGPQRPDQDRPRRGRLPGDHMWVR